MAGLNTGVFERVGDDTISRRMFYALLGGVLCWGFFATYKVSEMTATWQPSVWEMLGYGLLLPLLGILMSASSSAFLSFLGFNLVAIPFGAILGPVLAHYELTTPGVVGKAAMLTGGITAVMAISGVLFPQVYSRIGGALFWALLCLVGVSVLSLFVPFLRELTIIHYIACGIFSLYIGYDMHRASEIPATLDNVVDVATALYLDILNLFLRILAIMGKSD